ncbi:VOC family protein [Ruegeria sp.]|uniref:VOC family protein n=1 Tax=Ruegeria sp. TaxID=1879320 RepID=UPI003C798EF3
MSILHLSITASDPEDVAKFLAEIMGGEAMPFPPFPDSWIAFSEADNGAAIEVYPSTHTLIAGPEQVNCKVGDTDPSPTFAHVALGSVLSQQDLLNQAHQKGWTTRVCNRGPFECVEIWLENRVLVEALDSDMQRDYRAGMTMKNWAAMFGFRR